MAGGLVAPYSKYLGLGKAKRLNTEGTEDAERTSSLALMFARCADRTYVGAILISMTHFHRTLVPQGSSRGAMMANLRDALTQRAR